MSVAFADYDQDGLTDIFVTNDKMPNFLFHNKGNGQVRRGGAGSWGGSSKQRERGFEEWARDFRDYDNDGLPDIVFAALAGETFPTIPQCRERVVRGRHL